MKEKESPKSPSYFEEQPISSQHTPSPSPGPKKGLF